MICPYCKSAELKVVDKRESGSDSIRRRRECESCSKRFTTYERAELTPIIVIKKDGSKQEFDPEKIRMGIIKACEKRDISEDRIERSVEGVENVLREMGAKQIKSKDIGKLVMEQLKMLDEVAYLRFASVYRDFKDIQSFEKELKLMKKAEVK